MSQSKWYDAYTDGSYRESDGTFSYGAIILLDDHNVMLNGRINDRPEYAASRNVAGEIYGAIKVVQYAMRFGIKKVVIHHDYQGVGAWPTGVWKANIPLTKKYVDYMQKTADFVQVKFEWVKGHAGHEFNEQADRLAAMAQIQPWHKKVPKDARV